MARSPATFGAFFRSPKISTIRSHDLNEGCVAQWIHVARDADTNCGQVDSLQLLAEQHLEPKAPHLRDESSFGGRCCPPVFGEVA